MSSLLIHTVVDDDGEVVNRVVLPKGRRRMVLELAHDKCSHVGMRKTRDIGLDYKQLNNITPQRRYYLPSLADIMNKAGNCAVMSTLDLTAGLHQIRMSPECEEMTTFGCPAGKF